MPRATKVNDVVTVDLKKWSDGRYIMYLVGMFSRFTSGCFITNKKAETIGEAILRMWISIFGSMNMIHMDGGKEFNNTLIEELANYLDIRLTSTAAYSPNETKWCQQAESCNL